MVESAGYFTLAGNQPWINAVVMSTGSCYGIYAMVSKVDPCGVCSLRVKAKSVFCVQCG